MKVTNGIKIAMANKPLCYKMLFSRTVITVIAYVVCFLIANILIKDIILSQEVTDFFGFLVEELKNFILGNASTNADLSQNLNAHVTSCLSMLKGKVAEFTWIFITIILVIQVAKFFTSICDYVMAVNVNEHMSSMRHAEFFTTLVEHFSPAVRYAVYCVVSLLIYNALIFTVSTLLFILLIKYIGFLTFTVVLCFIIFLQNSIDVFEIYHIFVVNTIII